MIIDDDFSDGNFSTNPSWSGDTANFTVLKQSGNQLLQLDDRSYSGVSHLSTPIDKHVGEWRIYLEFPFAPSSYNFGEIFLLSDRADLKEQPTGIAVRFGESGSEDTFELIYYHEGKVKKRLLRDTLSIRKGGRFSLLVRHHTDGRWIMFTGSGRGRKLLPAPDTAYWNLPDVSFTHSGIRVYYSETRSDKFFFDFNFKLPTPGVKSVDLSKDHTLDLSFNRYLYTGNQKESPVFSIGDSLKPTKKTWLKSDHVRLSFHKPIGFGKHQLIINRIRPLIEPDRVYRVAHDFFVYDTLDNPPLFVNEFMADPPGEMVEYIELYNGGDQWIDLSKVKVGDCTRLVAVTAKPLPLAPGSFLTITPDTLTLQQHFGPGIYRQINQWASLNNGGDGLRLYYQDRLLEKITYEPEWVAAGKSLERRSIKAPASISNNWAPTLNLIGSASRPNTVKAETVRPRLMNIHHEHPTELLFTFSEAVSVSDYLTFGLVSPVKSGKRIETAASDTLSRYERVISVTLNKPMTPGHNYKIQIDTIRDPFGNPSLPIDTTYTYYKVQVPDSGDLHISEFLYKPPDEYPEYIELYNASKNAIDLSRILISDKSNGSIRISPLKKLLPPHSYTVISPSVHPSLPKDKTIILKTLPSLNNSGDAIVLSSEDNIVLDSLFYIPMWGGNGRALERRSFKTSSDYMDNWQPYGGPGIGSPGQPNLAMPDHQPPQLNSIEYLHEKALQFRFDQNLHKRSFNALEQFSASPRLIPAQTVIQDSTLIQFLQQPLNEEMVYRISLQDIEDPFGNKLTDTTVILKYIPTRPARPGDVVINEYRITGNPDIPKFVELYNRADYSISLQGWQLYNDRNDGTVIQNLSVHGSILRSGEYLALTTDTLAGDADQIKIDLPDFSIQGDIIHLTNVQRYTIDSLSYKSSFFPKQPRKSVERVDPADLSIDPSNWQSPVSNQLHTAGKINSNYHPDERSPVLQYAYVDTGNRIHLKFNEYIYYSDTATKIYLNNDRVSINPETPHPPDQLRINLKSRDLYPPRQITIRTHRLSDHKGNQTDGKRTRNLAYPPAPGDLLFTEVMFDPLADAQDHIQDQSEYIEIYNTRSYPLRIDHLWLREPADEYGVRSYKKLKPSSPYLDAYSYGLIYSDTASTYHRTDMAQYFTIPDTASLLQRTRQTLGLHNNEDSLILSWKRNIDVAKTHYKSDWHTDHLAESTGRSLEKVTLTPTYSGSADWNTSTTRRGGTPGYRNSILITSNQKQTKATLSLTPEIFSPNGDGWRDHLLIQYQFKKPDHLLDVRIYDRYGRFVVTLAEDRLAGLKGKIIWDGRDHLNRPCRIGPYIILADLYNPTHDIKKSIKKTAVLARPL